MDVMELMEPITRIDITYELKPGEWIWDSKLVRRRAHERSLMHEPVLEPVGFRQIHILNTEDFPRFTSKPFMLSDIDRGGYNWEYFEEGRFYRFKK